jgi:hypothetical protein
VFREAERTAEEKVEPRNSSVAIMLYFWKEHFLLADIFFVENKMM